MSNPCPKCSKDDQVQKVSAIYSNGIIRGETSTAQTDLSKTLAPPPLPLVKSRKGGVLILVVLAIACFAFSPVLLFDSSGISAVIFLLIFFIAIGVINRDVKKNKEDSDSALLTWQNTIGKKWNQLYYCYRDDCVFDPNSGKSVSPHNMNQLLF